MKNPNVNYRVKINMEKYNRIIRTSIKSFS